MAAVVPRSTALRAGGACVRCRKGKTKCVYDKGPSHACRNCAKGLHECYLPGDHIHGGMSPARVPHRVRESLPERSIDRQGIPAPVSRHVSSAAEKLGPELLLECERVIAKNLPTFLAFHKPSFLQQLKNNTMDATLVNALLTTAARHSPPLIRRYGAGAHGGPSAAAENFASKTINLVMQALDQPGLADIQALCLLVVHEWGCHNAVRAYIYLGQAARMAQMYRVVHTHHLSTEPDQFLMDESFRRTMWLIYILDCFLTSSPGRHPALSSHDINDVALPCLDMNFNFGSPVMVRTLSGAPPSTMATAESPLSPGEVGEFGNIVLATKAWRNVVEMMTTTTLETFSEDQCVALEQDIDAIRQALPMHFADKAGQINLHITMGSGNTYAMVHCLLNCAAIFLNRRRILQLVTAKNFSIEAWRMSPHAHLQTVDRVFAASHSIIHSLLSLETDVDKDTINCFPIFMLFSAFTAGSTVAYLVLKGLAPPNVSESAAGIVRDSLRLCADGSNSWPLVVPWQRHLSVMSKVLREVNMTSSGREMREESRLAPSSPHVKDEGGSQPDASNTPTAVVLNSNSNNHNHNNDSSSSSSSSSSNSSSNNNNNTNNNNTNNDNDNDNSANATIITNPNNDSHHEAMEYDSPATATIKGPPQQPILAPAQVDTREQQSPVPVHARRPGVTTINGGSVGVSTPATGSPPQIAKDSSESYNSPTTSTTDIPPPTNTGPEVDMTAHELCVAFEHQLLELDDLAAFMGGGVSPNN